MGTHPAASLPPPGLEPPRIIQHSVSLHELGQKQCGEDVVPTETPPLTEIVDFCGLGAHLVSIMQVL